MGCDLPRITHGCDRHVPCDDENRLVAPAWYGVPSRWDLGMFLQPKGRVRRWAGRTSDAKARDGRERPMGRTHK
jgi:hypothetical protein